MMYAVIESGGKQHRVEEGEVLKLEKIDVPAGDEVTFDRILLLGAGDSVKIGAPYVEGSEVTAEVLHQGRHPKIRVVKFIRRKNSRKTQGHRQYYTEVKITAIKGQDPGGTAVSSDDNPEPVDAQPAAEAATTVESQNQDRS